MQRSDITRYIGLNDTFVPSGRDEILILSIIIVEYVAKDGKNGRLNDKADWPEKEQRFFNALGPSPEEEAKERRAASEEKSGGVGAGDGAAGDEPRKKEEIKAESAAATAHFCLFRETAPLTKWPDKRNRTRGAIARNARSPWSPAPRVSLERSTTSLPVCRPHAAEGQRERVKRGDSRRYSDGFLSAKAVSPL